MYIADALSFLAHITPYSELLRRSGASHASRDEAKQAVGAAVQMFTAFGLGDAARDTLAKLHGKDMCDETV